MSLSKGRCGVATEDHVLVQLLLPLDFRQQHFFPVVGTVHVAGPQLRRHASALAIEQQRVRAGRFEVAIAGAPLLLTRICSLDRMMTWGFERSPSRERPACGSSGQVRYENLQDRAHGVAGDWRIMECSKCASGWLNPAPIPEDLGQCYVGSYYTHERPEAATLGQSRTIVLMRRLALSARKGYRGLKPSAPFSSILGSMLARIPPLWSRACFGHEDLLPSFKEGGRLLEIGCGGGRFLSIAQLLGWQVCGVEPDPVAAAFARELVGCEIHLGTIEDAAFDAEHFDAIVSSHVIEHAMTRDRLLRELVVFWRQAA